VNWGAPVDAYCERIDASFWSEPANALTNIAFVLAASLALRACRAGGLRDGFVLFLIATVAVIGVGSFAFHTLATRGAVLLDVIPITLFVYGYLYLALRRFIGVNAVAAFAVLAAFLVASLGLSALVPRDWLNGSTEYLPPLAALYLVGLWAQDRAVRRGILIAATTFTLSLFFRTIDQWACSAVPVGTHFAWHVLNAVVLYVLLSVAIAHSLRTGPAPVPPHKIR
jgi:hypothetical protein